MSERAARAQLADAEGQLSAQEASVAKLKKQLQARADDLATQRAVNQQLMLKKEEVEWQLLAAIAQVRACVCLRCYVYMVVGAVHNSASGHGAAPSKRK